jgi:putative DNA methylase
VTYRKKLIEVALPLDVINQESAREKSIRHGHPSTLHLWWARRPLAAARAVLFAQLVDDPSSHPDRFPTEEDQRRERKRLFDILERLVPWEASNNEKILAEARAEILKSCDGKLPTIIDPFGGGGAIPLESARLGLPTVTGDLNPVAVLIQKAMLEIPHRFAGKPPIHPDAKAKQTVWNGAEGLAADIEAYGRWMREEAHKRIGHLYPDVTLDDGTKATPIAWIWARTVKSPDPTWPAHVPLVRSWELRRRPGKPSIWVEPKVDHATKTISYAIRQGGKPPEGTIGRRGGICLATGTAMPFTYVREQAKAGGMGETLIAVVAEGQNGRRYVSGTDIAPVTLPTYTKPSFGDLPKNPRDFKTPNYGLTQWTDLFAPRQLLALTTFSDLVKDLHAKVISDAIALGSDATPLRDGGSGATAYADAICTYTAFVVDKCADYWSSICTWHHPGEFIRNTFARQAIPMAWDFAETNPFSASTGNWMSMIDWEKRALLFLSPKFSATSSQIDASANLARHAPAVLSTDPPYYDNISYADLSDFFYVWLRRNLSNIWPNECATLLTPKAEELIANPYRAGSKDAAKVHFETGMEKVSAAAASSAEVDYPAAIFYAFKATESDDSGIASTGWETFLEGLLRAGWSITATWPIRTEMQSKIGMNAGDNMLASSIVLACRKRLTTAPLATRSEFVAELRKEMLAAVKILQQQNIAPVDLAQSAIGPGVAIFSRFSRVVEANGSDMTIRSALVLVNEVLSEILSGEEAEFDADTRFALTWYEQFGFSDGQFGDADVLAKAKNTTVDNVVRAGVAQSKGGKIRLIPRSDLPPDWNPVEDKHLTVWEVAHHLIRALEDSEAKAAALLKIVGGGLGDRARQLAYLLFQVSDRKKRADDAAAYNMLVAAWPQLLKLGSDTSGTSKDGLF